MFSVSNLVLLANVLSLKRLLHIILSEKKEGLEEAWWNYKSIDLNSFKILPSVIILQHQQVKDKLPLNFCLAQNQNRFFLKPPTYKHCLIKPLKSLDPNVPLLYSYHQSGHSVVLDLSGNNINYFIICHYGLECCFRLLKQNSGIHAHLYFLCTLSYFHEWLQFQISAPFNLLYFLKF